MSQVHGYVRDTAGNIVNSLVTDDTYTAPTGYVFVVLSAFVDPATHYLDPSNSDAITAKATMTPTITYQTTDPIPPDGANGVVISGLPNNCTALINDQGAIDVPDNQFIFKTYFVDSYDIKIKSPTYLDYELTVTSA